MKEKAPATVVLVAAIIGIVILEAIALLQGINGALFMASIGIVGLIAGVPIGKLLRR